MFISINITEVCSTIYIASILISSYLNMSVITTPSSLQKIEKYIVTVTPNMLLIHTSFTCSKLNMGDFSVLNGPLGYVDCR